jgi:hypothetical protein
MPPERTTGGSMRFSSVLRPEKMPRSSGQKPTPRRVTRCGAMPISSRPLNMMEPLRRPTRPIIDFKVVDRPEPLRPSRVTSSPSATRRSMPCSTWDSP